MTMWKFFKKEEFACSCGCGENNINEALIDVLDKIRAECGFPFHITSGYRCEKHNAAVGGSKNSAHVDGLAADIHCKYSSQRYTLLGVAFRNGINRVGVADSFIHLDIAKDRSQDVLWTY